MNFISELPRGPLAVANMLGNIGFQIEPIIRTAKGYDYAVGHNTAYRCAVYYNIDMNEINIGADNKPFKPDLKYTLSISGAVSPELLTLVSNAATSYEKRVRGSYEDEADKMFEGNAVSPYDAAHLNRDNANYWRAYSKMESLGLVDICNFIKSNNSDAMKCATSAIRTSVYSDVPGTMWKHMCLVYNKIAPWVATTQNVGNKISQNNVDNDTSNIASFSDEIIDVDQAELDDRKSEAELAKQAEKYYDSLEEITNFVKAASDVVIKHKPNRMFTTRGLLVVGTSGSSKTYTVETTLKNEGLKQGVDFVTVNSRTTATMLYNNLYTYNNKILILDDIPNPFIGQERVQFWKTVTETKSKPISAPAADVTKTSGGYYPPEVARNRKERFFFEAGWTPKKKEDYLSGKVIKSTENDLKPVPKSLPNKFNYTGCVIVICNTDLEGIERGILGQKGSKADWAAVRDRFDIVQLAPPVEVLWEDIKKHLIADKENKDLNDNTRLLNSKYVDFVISEVERLMAEPGPCELQWRTIIEISRLVAPNDEDPIPSNIERIITKKLQQKMHPDTSF